MKKTESVAFESASFNSGLLTFLTAAKTPFHAVATMVQRFEQRGYSRLREDHQWSLQAGNGYFVTRGGSSIIAFRVGTEAMSDNGIRMAGAHTDSPCLMVKPQPELTKNGYFQLGVEVYGGALLAPWFDRDLSIAGRVAYRTADGEVRHRLVDFERPVATVPSLAIHLDRDQNSSRNINPQTQLPPIVMLAGDSKSSLKSLLQDQFFSNESVELLSYELCLYDTQAAALVGLNNEFIASARLDNLLSCYVGMEALLAADGTQTSLLVCNDHEEVGSVSAQGANGPFLADVLQRLVPDANHHAATIYRSMMISCDNAHAVHPNFADRHDGNHLPMINGGPVIKTNSNQRYASNSSTAGLFRTWCQQCDVPVQDFVTRTDLGCGSTIGPITAGAIGVKTLDIGIPQLAMHSVRELTGSEDASRTARVLTQFLNEPRALVVDQDE